jgi:hypothetical protein
MRMQVLVVYNSLFLTIMASFNKQSPLKIRFTNNLNKFKTRDWLKAKAKANNLSFKCKHKAIIMSWINVLKLT